MTSSLSFPQLELVCILRLDIDPKGPGASGSFRWFNIVSGSSISTEALPSKLDLEVLPGSGDLATLHPEHAVLSLNVRVVAQDRAKNDLYLFEGRGSVDTSCKMVQDILNGAKTARTTHYGEGSMLETITCSTSSKEFGWMNFANLIADGRLVVEDEVFVAVELRLFRVVSSRHSHIPEMVEQMLKLGVSRSDE